MCGSQLKMQFKVENAITSQRYESQSATISIEGKLQNTQTQELRKCVETQTPKNSAETNAIVQIIQVSCTHIYNMQIVHLAYNHHVLTVTCKSSIFYLTII